ncbi:tagatose-bisphosphate aldolase [Providencia heimbachae]|uniref:Tagatose-bisphosphate aldolase n=1 Tax=Providencia heimbachae ATCC 35613 TaxID=1354272 RepID=A0A1B7JYS1_9GAMM|nr:tagatose-bisphosphate aldolase [Providencia heimbachae]OAT52874.1 tagatose 1,6-diphosphate aldolase [Providencia heimbachae ATCC 35613]SQH14584.1 Tagatose 1,6-diphosphate aldolase 2 [Providencia heimbachae]
MIKLTNKKVQALKKLSSKSGIIAALAIDQRGALKKMFNSYQESHNENENITNFKSLVSTELTPYASSILLDPEYGLPAARVRDKNAGLLLAYEKTGYDSAKKGRLPDLLDNWSVKRLKNSGADAIKFLLYYDIDEEQSINDHKHAFIERLGAECAAEDIPFFLELVSYDATNIDSSSREYAKLKPYKVNEMMKEFSKENYSIDILKVEIPVNMLFVEGYSDDNDYVYTQKQAESHFKEQSMVTNLPFIFLSAGVSSNLFLETLLFAKKSGSTFNGVLCGRATWANSVEYFATDSENAARLWLQTEGKKNICQLNKILEKTASSWFDKLLD